MNTRPATDTRASATVHEWRREAALTLAAGSTAATFLPALGMLGVSFVVHGREVLALPRNLLAYRNGHVTGLPLLAPWANRLSSRHYRASGVDVDLTHVTSSTDDNGLPIHGTMTARAGWEINAVHCEGEHASVDTRFDYDTPDVLPAFPFPHVLTLAATVTPGRLRVVTTLTPSGDRAVPVSFGFHPYLSLTGGPRASWVLALPARRHVALDARGIPTGVEHDEPAERAALGTRTFDDHYALGPDRSVSIEGAGARVVVGFDDGYPRLQLFAPSRRPFLCVEPMTAPVDALVSGDHPTVAPGQTFEAAFTITVDVSPGG